MKLLIVFVLLVVFIGTAFATQSRDEILSQIEALEQAKEFLAQELKHQEAGLTPEFLSERSYPLDRCVAVSSLNVRTDSGSLTGRVTQDTKVTIWAAKQMNGLEYGKIGNNRWIALKFVKMCSTQPSQPSQPTQPSTGFPLDRCTNANSLNVRTDAGSLSGERLPDNTPVKVWATKQMNGLGYGKIGNNRWVATKYLKMKCSAAPSPSAGGDKLRVSLREVFGHEGKCQNWRNDSGNWMNSRLGYTCMGIIPSVGWNSRNSMFGYAANGYRGSPEMFVKYAYDKDKAQFKRGAELIYKRDYFDKGGCGDMAMPAYYVCGDIAINSGVGRSREFIRSLGNLRSTASISEVKSYATRMNQLHREFYKRIGAPGKKNNTFLRGWLARADSRDAFINRY